MSHAIGANIQKDSERLMPRGRFIRGREHEPRGQNGVRQFPYRRLANQRAPAPAIINNA